MKQKIETAYEYKASVVKWVDGDTCDILVDLGFGVSIQQRVRLYGINTPETNSGNDDERSAGVEAKLYARSIAPATMVVKVKTVKDKDKYGRFLAVMTNADGLNIAEKLIEQGYGKPYFGGAR